MTGSMLYEQPGRLLELEPYVGLRAWRTRDDTLVSVHRSVLWPDDGPLVAACEQVPLAHGLAALFARRPPPKREGQTHEGDEVPCLPCTCGIYAVRTSPECLRFISRPGQGQMLVFGLVRMWGIVIEHEDGWRAQYAQPEALWGARTYVPDPSPPAEEEAIIDELVHVQDIIERLGDVYDVPVIGWGTMELEAR